VVLTGRCLSAVGDARLGVSRDASGLASLTRSCLLHHDQLDGSRSRRVRIPATETAQESISVSSGAGLEDGGQLGDRSLSIGREAARGRLVGRQRREDRTLEALCDAADSHGVWLEGWKAGRLRRPAVGEEAERRGGGGLVVAWAGSRGGGFGNEAHPQASAQAPRLRACG